MNRDYSTGTADNITFFTGMEVEKTPAFGLRTLFVTGVQDIYTIEKYFIEKGCQHIFFGANHSFAPHLAEPDQLFDSWKEWEDMIYYFLDKNILCTLDIPLDACATFHDSGLCERDNFIPQIRVPLPYTKLWNYNTMVKIDDVDFKATNPGVWCHSLQNLMSREAFTDWSQYKDDEVLDDNN